MDILLPQAFADRMKQKHTIDYKAFINSLNEPPVVSIRLNPLKTDQPPDVISNSNMITPIPWSRYGYYLTERPSFTFDPSFHAGAYYVQEASSMFLEEILRQHININQPLKVLDLCAAPGGKSSHLLSLINEESILIANETITHRCNILAENIIRWGNKNCIVTNNDPEHFSEYQNCFDVVLVDAPCSGEGMFRKDPNSINEWSEKQVTMCSTRQKRIIDQAVLLVRPGGLLIYSTCTYAEQENEENIDYVLKNYSFNPLRLSLQETWGIQKSKNLYGYQFMPHLTKGEGFFISVLKKNDAEPEGKWPFPSKRISYTTKSAVTIFNKWLQSPTDFDFIQHKENTLAIPKNISANMLGVLNTSLHIRLFGITIGKVIRDELIPAYHLALSTIYSQEIPTVSLSHEEAIGYLQKKEINLKTNHKGWQLVNYKNNGLGWVKVLTNRINNAYPKEWRIRKESVE